MTFSDAAVWGALRVLQADALVGTGAREGERFFVKLALGVGTAECLPPPPPGSPALRLVEDILGPQFEACMRRDHLAAELVGLLLLGITHGLVTVAEEPDGAMRLEREGETLVVLPCGCYSDPEGLPEVRATAEAEGHRLRNMDAAGTA